jgi:hypothetical protein
MKGKIRGSLSVLRSRSLGLAVYWSVSDPVSKPVWDSVLCLIEGAVRSRGLR